MCKEKRLVSRQQRWRGGWSRFPEFIRPFRGLIVAKYSEDRDGNIWLIVIVCAFRIKQSSPILSCSAKKGKCVSGNPLEAQTPLLCSCPSTLSVRLKTAWCQTRFRTQSTAFYAVDVPLSACNMTYARPCSIKLMCIKESSCNAPFSWILLLYKDCFRDREAHQFSLCPLTLWSWIKLNVDTWTLFNCLFRLLFVPQTLSTNDVMWGIAASQTVISSLLQFLSTTPYRNDTIDITSL